MIKMFHVSTGPLTSVLSVSVSESMTACFDFVMFFGPETFPRPPALPGLVTLISSISSTKANKSLNLKKQSMKLFIFVII